MGNTTTQLNRALLPSRTLPEPLPPSAAQQSRDPLLVPSEVVYTTERACEIIADLPNWAERAMDTETVREATVNPRTAKLRTIQIATARVENGETLERAYLLDVRDMDRAALTEAFRAAGRGLYRNRLSFMGWNAGFDDPVASINLTGKRGQEFSALMEWDDLMLYEAALRLGAKGNSWYAGLADATLLKTGVRLEGKGTVQLSYDADSDLTSEQATYGIIDAIATLWTGRVLRKQVRQAQMEEITADEVAARPVFQGMKIYGLEFNVEGWMKLVRASQASAAAASQELALMTGGGQGNLFSDEITPDWNPASDVQAKAKLNELVPDLVRAFTAKRDGVAPENAPLLAPADSVDKNTLQLIGGDLATLIARFRKDSKVATTYGAEMMNLVEEDGRMHPDYTQCLIATGRASSRNPNAQNFAPAMKYYFRTTWREDPSVPGGWVPRVFVMGDFSQAELRVLAQLTGEKTSREAFANGIDLHEATAGAMFKVDMQELLKSDKASYDTFRSKAKPLNFGIPYGMREGLLATQLTIGGNPTTKDEAKDLLNAYYEALPANAKWLRDRDAFVASISEGFNLRARGQQPHGNPGLSPELDFESTWQLHRLYGRINQIKREITKARKAAVDTGEMVEKPSSEDVVEILSPRSQVEQALTSGLGRPATQEEVDAEMARRLDRVEWAQSFVGSVVLRKDGTPFSFESRTIGGRRRLFQVGTEDWVASMAVIAATSTKPAAMEVRANWEKLSGKKLSEIDPKSGQLRALDRGKLKKFFEDKEIKLSFVSYVLENMPQGANFLMYSAVADRVRADGNAYRNAPIQGSVADAVLRCFANLYDRLEEFPTAHVVLSVHDSVGIECDLADAPAILPLLKEVMEESLAYFCPDVVVKADVDIQASLDAKKDTVGLDEVPTLLEFASSLSEPMSVQQMLREREAAQAAAESAEAIVAS